MKKKKKKLRIAIFVWSHVKVEDFGGLEIQTPFPSSPPLPPYKKSLRLGEKKEKNAKSFCTRGVMHLQVRRSLHSKSWGFSRDGVKSKHIHKVCFDTFLHWTRSIWISI